MAKHEVKCPYCNIIFDTNKEDFIQLNRRYAHKACYDAAGGEKPPKQVRAKKAEKTEDPDLIALKDYIQSLFGDKTNWAMVTKQIKNYKEEYKYSYSGILKSLIYFYDVKGNSKEKSNNAIGIVPFCYQAAFDYYYGLFIAQQQTKDISFSKVEKEYIINPPKKRGSKQKLFNLGDTNEE